MTRKEIWERLPGELRVNEVRFRQVLEAGVRKGWEKDAQAKVGSPFVYWRLEG